MKSIVIMEKMWNKTMLSHFHCINVILYRAYRPYLHLYASSYVTVKSWVCNFLLSCCLYAKCCISVSPKCFEGIGNFDGHKGLLLSSTMVAAGLDYTNSVLLLLGFWEMLNGKI